MSFTNPVSAIGTAITGSSVTTATFATPSPGQLMVVNVRCVCSSTPAITITGWTAIGSPLAVASNDYTQMFYKVAVGTETSVTASFTNASLSASPAEAVISYLEIDGFSGTPTLDVSATGTGSSGLGGASSSVSTTVANEVAVSAVACNNTFTSSQGNFPSASHLTGNNTAGATNSLQAMGWLGLTSTHASATFSWNWVTSRVWGVTGATFYDLAGTNVTAAAASALGSGTAQSAPPSVGASAGPVSAWAWAHSHASQPVITAGVATAYGSGVAQGGTPAAGTGAAATAAPAFGWAGATALPASVGISTGPASAFGWGEGAAGTATAAASVTAGTASAWGSGASRGAAAGAGVTSAAARTAGSGTAQAGTAAAGTGVVASPASASGAGGATAGTATATSSNNALAQTASAYGHGHSHAERANVTTIVNVTYATGFSQAGSPPIAIPSAGVDNLLRVSVVVNRSGGALPSSPQLPTDNMSGAVGWEWEGVLATDGGIGAWSAVKVAVGGETEITLKWTGGLGGSGTSEARILEVTNSVGGVPTLDAGASGAGGGVTVGNGFTLISASHPNDILLASVATDGNNGGLTSAFFETLSNTITTFASEADTVNSDAVLLDAVAVGINPDSTGEIDFVWVNSQNWVILGGLYYWAPNVPAQPQSAEGHGYAQSGTPSVSVTAKGASAYGAGHSHSASPIIAAGQSSAYGQGTARSGPIVVGIITKPVSAFGWGTGGNVVATDSAPAQPASAWGWGQANVGALLSGRAYGSGHAQAGEATATAIWLFTPPTIADDPQYDMDATPSQVRLYRHFQPHRRGINVFKLSDGTYVQDTASPENSNTNIPYPMNPFPSGDPPGEYFRGTSWDGTVITAVQAPYVVLVYFGGHEPYVVDAAEHAALVAAGYGDCF